MKEFFEIIIKTNETKLDALKDRILKIINTPPDPTPYPHRDKTLKEIKQEFLVQEKRIQTLKNLLENYHTGAKKQSDSFKEYLKKKNPDPFEQEIILDAFDNFLSAYEEEYEKIINELIKQIADYNDRVSKLLDEMDTIIDEHKRNIQLN